MAEQREEWIIKLQDQVTAGLNKIDGELKQSRSEFGKLQTKLNQTSKGMAGVGRSSKTASSGLGGLKGALGGLGIAFGAVAIGGKIVSGIKASTEAFNEQQQAIAQVRTGLQSTGGTAGRTLGQLQKQASELQEKTIFGDEQILKEATAQLLTFTNISGTQFDRTQKAALDLATRLDGDLKSASIQLGKALNDPKANLSALSRSGIQFSEDQKKVINSLQESGRLAEAQGIILNELDKQYGGSAEAAAQAGTGGFKQLQNAFGDVQERIGGMIVSSSSGLVPALKEVISFFNMMLDNIAPVKAIFIEIKALFMEQTEALQEMFQSLGLVTDKASGAKGVMEGLAFILKIATAQFRFMIMVQTKVIQAITWVIQKFKEFKKEAGFIGDVVRFISEPFDRLFELLTNLPAKLAGLGSAISKFFSKVFSGDFTNLGEDSREAFNEGFMKKINEDKRAEMARKVAEINEQRKANAIGASQQAGDQLSGLTGGTGTGDGKKSSVTGGVSEVRASAPKTFIINIENLVRELSVNTTNITESVETIQREVERVLLSAVNDVQIQAQ